MLPSFPPQASPTTISSLTLPRSLSPQSTATLPLWLLYTPQTPAPSCCSFQGTLIPVWGMYGYGKGCLILIPFRLPKISYFTLSLKMFLLWLRQLPGCGDQTPASVPPPTKGRSSPTNTPVFPPTSFLLPSFVWFYIFFSSGQALLSAVSCCSACTSVSEGVFLMYPWREMYFTSTYSSAILFSLWNCFLINIITI